LLLTAVRNGDHLWTTHVVNDAELNKYVATTHFVGQSVLDQSIGTGGLLLRGNEWPKLSKNYRARAN
jgi:16S rRNA G527 N7-methylase RsmG